MGGRRFLGFGAVALAVGLLAGCNGGSDDPTTSAPVSVEPTVDATTEVVTVEPTDDPTPDPTPTDPWALGPPAVTLDMQYDTEEGAVAFVEHYVDLANYTFDTLDTESISAISDLNCVGCQSLIDSVTSIKEAGYHREGGWRTVLNIVSSVYYDDHGVYIVKIEAEDDAAELLDDDGNVIQSNGSVSDVTTFTVQYLGPYDWRMIAFGSETT